MIYFLYNKFKNKLYKIYDLNDFEKQIGNIENYSSAYDGFLKVSDYGFNRGRQNETTFESNAGAEGSIASNFSGTNNIYTFDVIAIDNGNNFQLADNVHKLYQNQFLYLGGVNPETNQGFITEVVPASDIDLENGYLSFVSQSNNILFNVSFGSSLKDITFIKEVYSKALASASDTLTIESDESSACIVKYPNTAAQEITVKNKTNQNKFTIEAGEKNIKINAYDRTASSDNGDLFELDTFSGGFIYLDQGTNVITIDATSYGNTLTIETLTGATIRKAYYG